MPGYEISGAGPANRFAAFRILEELRRGRGARRRKSTRRTRRADAAHARRAAQRRSGTDFARAYGRREERNQASARQVPGQRATCVWLAIARRPRTPTEVTKYRGSASDGRVFGAAARQRLEGSVDMRMNLSAAIAAALLTAMFASPPAAAQKATPSATDKVTIDGWALSMSNVATGANQMIRINIDKWSNPGQREQLINTFLEKKQDGLLK